jgi:hypothetical protein
MFKMMAHNSISLQWWKTMQWPWKGHFFLQTPSHSWQKSNTKALEEVAFFLPFLLAQKMLHLLYPLISVWFTTFLATCLYNQTNSLPYTLQPSRWRQHIILKHQPSAYKATQCHNVNSHHNESPKTCISKICVGIEQVKDMSKRHSRTNLGNYIILLQADAFWLFKDGICGLVQFGIYCFKSQIESESPFIMLGIITATDIKWFIKQAQMQGICLTYVLNLPFTAAEPFLIWQN